MYVPKLYVDYYKECFCSCHSIKKTNPMLDCDTPLPDNNGYSGRNSEVVDSQPAGHPAS